YKWRKSLNKHWKEKHNDEEAPPLDAPVTIRPSKLSHSKTLTSVTSDMLPTSLDPNSSQQHPAFPFSPYAWFKLATNISTNLPTDQSPLDLRIKATEHPESEEDDGKESSDDASSSSPQNSYGQKIFICSICDQRFLSIELVNEHFAQNHLHELENEIAGKSPPRNTNVAQQNEEWNLSDPVNPLKCIQCDFVGRWPTELQKHAASHSTSRPFKCLVCSLTYKWRWDLAKHWDRAHASGVKGTTLINPYKKRDRDQARSMMDIPANLSAKVSTNLDRHSISSSTSNENVMKLNFDQHSDDEQSQNSILSDNEDEQNHVKRLKQNDDKRLFLPPPPPVPSMPSSIPPSMYFPSAFFPHHPMFSSFINPSLLLQPKFNYSARMPALSMNPNLDLLKQASAFMQQSSSPHSSRSSSSSSPHPPSPSQQHQQRQQQQRMNAVAAMVAAGGSTNSNTSSHLLRQQQHQRRVEKEDRNFQCRWCDYRGRWRSELIQHMRCHHAKDKPYHCSACPYASSWKWDVQKHVKKQHAHDAAKIVELPDKYLFQTTLKAKYEGTDDRSLAPTPLTEEDYTHFGADVQEKLSSIKYTRDRTLSCQQCPFAANSMAELRRHLIVHSAESPYHCFNCNYKSKWKCDVKKHMKICNHHGPVLVGRKAMAKVMESLGLVIDSNGANSSEKVFEQKSLDDEEEDEIIVDENQQEEANEKQKINSRSQNNHLRCRQCDYEANDLCDLLSHRKNHALAKTHVDTDKKYNSDIENDDNNQSEQIFDYEMEWLENNPLVKQFTTVHEKTRSILYQCSKCNYQTNNNHQHFLNHIDHQHPNLLEVRIKSQTTWSLSSTIICHKFTKMNSSKVIFYVLFAIFLIQMEISFGKPVNDDGLPLKEILKIALRLDDCSRRIHVQEPIPLRFRRGSIKDRFPFIVSAGKRRYDGNVLVSVTPYEEEHFKILMNFEDQNEIDIWNEMGRNRSTQLMFNHTKTGWMMPLFEKLNMKPKILQNDVQQLLDAEESMIQVQARSGVPRGIQDTFHTYDQLTTWLKQMASTYSTLATLQSIGKTYENRDIWLLKITGTSGSNKKKAFLDFGIHAREWISPATGAYMINEFLTTYASGGTAKEILDSWELHFVPILNPDGYAYSHSNDRMWRKNRKPAGSGCYGVDLNRNFGYQFNTGGSSSSACSDTFHGGSAMSENEAKALQNYMTGKQWNTYLTFHSYGQGYTKNDPPNFALLKAKAKIGADAIKSVNGRSYTIGSSAQLLYVASGGSEDWTRGDLQVLYSYCIELPPTGGNGFIVAASEIKKTGYETYVGIVAYLKGL
ncbi:unnamed protein product, partial [Adineta ricciae]